MQSSTDLEKAAAVAAAAAAAKLRIGGEVAAAPDAETMMTTSFHPPFSPETAAAKATAELRIDGEVAAAPDAETTPATSCHPALSPETDPAVSRPSRPGPSVARARARSRALEAAAAATAPAPETTACTSSPQLLSGAPSSSCGAGDLSMGNVSGGAHAEEMSTADDSSIPPKLAPMYLDWVINFVCEGEFPKQCRLSDEELTFSRVVECLCSCGFKMTDQLYHMKDMSRGLSGLEIVATEDTLLAVKERSNTYKILNLVVNEPPGASGKARMTTVTCSNCKLEGHRFPSCSKPLRADLQIRKNKHKSYRSFPGEASSYTPPSRVPPPPPPKAPAAKRTKTTAAPSRPAAKRTKSAAPTLPPSAATPRPSSAKRTKTVAAPPPPSAATPRPSAATPCPPSSIIRTRTAAARDLVGASTRQNMPSVRGRGQKKMMTYLTASGNK